MFSLQLGGGGNAGPGGLAVHQNGAGAAGALAASVLDGRQVQLVPQKADELLVAGGVDLRAVDEKCCHIKHPPRYPMGAVL